MADGINLRLRRRDMNVFRTIDEDGRRPVVHVAGRHPVALCPSCSRPSVTTNGSGWRDVIDVVRTVVVTLSICVGRFVCGFEDCAQHTVPSTPSTRDSKASAVEVRQSGRSRSSRISSVAG